MAHQTRPKLFFLCKTALVLGDQVLGDLGTQLVDPPNPFLDCLEPHCFERAIPTHLVNGASANKLSNVGPFLSTYHRQTVAPTSNTSTGETGTPGAGMLIAGQSLPDP